MENNPAVLATPVFASGKTARHKPLIWLLAVVIVAIATIGVKLQFHGPSQNPVKSEPASINQTTKLVPPILTLNNMADGEQAQPVNDGQVISGAVRLSIKPSNNAEIKAVRFSLSGLNLSNELTTKPFNYTWNSSQTRNGTYLLGVIVTFSNGLTDSSSVNVEVKNIKLPATTINITALGGSTSTSTSSGTSGSSSGGSSSGGSSIDKTSPNVTVSSPASNAYVKSSVPVKATATDNIGVVGVQFQIDGINLGSEDTTSPYSRSWNTLTTFDGQHTLTAIARDAAGNTTTSSSVIVTVDNSPPTTAISSPSNSATVSGTTSIVASAADNSSVASVQFKLDGVNLGALDTSSPFSISWDTTSAVDGSHTLTAVAKDAAGNSTTSTTVTVTVDNTAPTVSLSAPGDSTFVSGSSVSVSASASDNLALAGVQFKLDGISLGAEDTSAPYAITWDSTAQSNGSHILSAVAFDAAGNTTTSSSVSVTVDNSLPSIALTAPASSALVRGSISVSATASDNIGIAGVQFQKNGSNLGLQDTSSPYSIIWDTTQVPDGSYDLTAIATDLAGNTNTSGTVTISVDNTAPTVSMTAPNDGDTVSNSVSISANASDNTAVAGVQFKLDGNNLGAEDTSNPYSVSWDTTAVANGSHTLTVVAFDTAGNSNTASSITVTVNNTSPPPPDTTPPSVPTGLHSTSITQTTIDIAWTASTDSGSGVAGYNVYRDGSLIASTSLTSYSDSNLTTNTAYSYSVSAFDNAANESAQSSADVITTLDNPPTVSIDASPTFIAGGSSSTLSWSSTNATSCTASDGWSGSKAISGSASTGALSVTTTFTLTCSSTGGSNQASATVTVDATPPTVSITAPSDSATVSGATVTLSANASDDTAVAGVQFKVDGNNIGSEDTSSPYSISWDTTSLANGSHNLTAVARDTAGNTTTSSTITVMVDNSPVVDSVTIDQANPKTNDTLTATINAHSPANRPLTYTYQWLKNGSNIVGATSSTLDLSQAGNGSKGDTISLRVVANDGFYDSAALTSSTVTIINTAPTATVSLNTATPDTDATITATATKADVDGDTVTLTYVWKVNGTTKQTTTTTALTDTFDLSLSGQGDNGDSVSVTVTPNDGTTDGTAAADTATVTALATGTFAEYSISGSFVASGIYEGPDGNAWFTLEVGAGQTDSVGKITPGGVITLYTIPSAGNSGGITKGPDGNMWFTEFNANKVAKITTSGTITEYALPSGTGPGGITTGSDNFLWVMGVSSNKIVKFDPTACTSSCTFTSYSIPTGGALPHGPRLGPDGNIWFGEFNTNKVAKITTSGTFTEYSLPNSGSKPDVFAPGPDGNMWFTEFGINKVAKITTSGTITEYTVPTASSNPLGIIEGPDGNMWISEQAANKIARVTTSGVFTEYTVPTASAQPDKLTVGSDGNIWFTEHAALKIGRISP